MLLLGGIFVSLMSVCQQKIVYERFGIDSKMTSTPIMLYSKLSIEQDETNTYILTEERNDVEITFKFFENGNGKYIYKGSGNVGYQTYNTVILSSVVKLSSLLRGNANSIENPFDDKYKIQVLFSQVAGLNVSRMETVDYYIVENVTQEEIDAENKRKEEEKRQEEKKTEVKGYISRVDRSELNQAVKSFVVNKFVADPDLFYRLYDNGGIQLYRHHRILLYADSSDCKIVKIGSEIIEPKLSEKYSRDLNHLQIDGISYYEYAHGVFYEENIFLDFAVECNKILLVKKTNKGYKYFLPNFYGKKVEMAESSIPRGILELINEKVPNNGKYYIDYTRIDEEILEFKVEKYNVFVR